MSNLGHQALVHL